MTNTEEHAEIMAQTLERAAIWFRGYACDHRAKKTPAGDIKAVINEGRATELEVVVDAYRREARDRT